jgi:hypothetical protein
MAGLFDDLIAPAAPAAAAPAPAGGLFDDLVSAVPLPPARPASFTEESADAAREAAELGGAPATIDMPPMQALDDVAPRVTPEPAAKPGMLSTIGSALTRGVAT